MSTNVDFLHLSWKQSWQALPLPPKHDPRACTHLSGHSEWVGWHLTSGCSLLLQDLGMESTSLDDVLYRYASFRNLVDPITHDLIISLARYIHCPKPVGSCGLKHPSPGVWSGPLSGQCRPDHGCLWSWSFPQQKRSFRVEPICGFLWDLLSGSSSCLVPRFRDGGERL